MNCPRQIIAEPKPYTWNYSLPLCFFFVYLRHQWYCRNRIHPLIRSSRFPLVRVSYSNIWKQTLGICLCIMYVFVWFHFTLWCFHVEFFSPFSFLVCLFALFFNVALQRYSSHNHSISFVSPISVYVSPPCLVVFNYRPAFTTIKIITFTIYMHRLFSLLLFARFSSFAFGVAWNLCSPMHEYLVNCSHLHKNYKSRL